MRLLHSSSLILIVDALASLCLAYPSSLHRCRLQCWTRGPRRRVCSAGSVGTRSTAEGAPPSDESPPLTILIPAYNEEFRIGGTLESIEAYLRVTPQWTEPRIVVVDDGSSDRTRDVVGAIAASSTVPLECIRTEENQGKGAALSFGVRHIVQSRPHGLILTTDADGSGNVTCLEPIFSSLASLLKEDGSRSNWNVPAMVVGYRTYDDTHASRLLFRWGFRTVVRLICGDLGVRDSQCGLKLMTATAAKALYSDLNLQGWSHDVEVLYRCRELGIPVAETPVIWNDMPGSKLVASGVVGVIVQMFFDVLLLRLLYIRKRTYNGL